MQDPIYQVCYGDSLWKIAEKKLGDPLRWSEIARLNQIDSPELLYIGQELHLPHRDQRFSPSFGTKEKFQDNSLFSFIAQHQTTYAYGRAFTFFIADEFDLARPKYVRRVAYPVNITDPRTLKKILNPDIYGFSPRDINSNVSITGHVTGRTDSKFISVSALEQGAARHGDRVFYIDPKRLKNQVVSLDTIIHEMQTKIVKIEQQIASAVQKNNSAKSIAALKDQLARTQRSLGQAIADAENLVVGHIPPSVIKGAAAMKTTRVMRWLTGVNVLFTTVDYSRATAESIQKSSVVPLKKETMRQAGGYAGRSIGFWAGARIGAGLGTTFTIELGPWALAGGLVGGLVFGAMGYFGADCLADYVYQD